MPNQHSAPWKPEEDKILRMYYGSKTYSDMAKMIKSRSKQAVKNRCKVLGLHTSKTRWTEHELDILRKNYTHNPHICELLPRWSWESIKKQANYMGLHVRYGTYKFNSDFFSKPTDNSVYVAGFIAADGYLNIKANRIEIAIKAADRVHLINIAKAMGFNGPIYEKSAINAVRLQITSQKLLSDIIEILGVTNNKTLALEKANVNDVMFHHFIRGYFDGDGYIKATKKAIRLLGTEMFLAWCDEKINSLIGIRRRNPKRKGHENIYELSYLGDDMMQICSWMYTGATLFLDRKYQRYVGLSRASHEANVAHPV